jgi:hypothetical protein
MTLNDEKNDTAKHNNVHILSVGEEKQGPSTTALTVAGVRQTAAH